CSFGLLNNNAKSVNILKDEQIVRKFLEHPCGNILGCGRKIDKNGFQSGLLKKACAEGIRAVTEEGMIERFDKRRTNGGKIKIIKHHPIGIRHAGKLDRHRIGMPVDVAAPGVMEWQAVSHLPTKRL